MLSQERDNKSIWYLILISLSVVMSLQVIRVFVTCLVNAFGERYGQTLAAVPALIAFLAPFVAPFVVKLLGTRKALIFSVGGLAIARLIMQILQDINLNLIVSGLATMLALIALVQAFSRLSSASALSRRQFAQAIFIGLTLETALHGAFLTWDYVWQPGVIPSVTALLVCVVAVYALLWIDFQDQPASAPGLRNLLPLAAIGSFFMLEILFLQNMAFIASSSHTSLEVAFATILIGNAIGIWIPDFFTRQGLPVRLIAGVVLVICAYLLVSTSGAVIILIVLIGQAASAGLLGSVLGSLSNPNPHPDTWRVSIVIGIGSLLFVLLSILYYIGALITLPFSPSILPPLAAVLLLLTAFVPAMPLADTSRTWRLAGLPVLLLLIPLVLFITRPASSAVPAATTSFRLMDYNTHQAITFDGWLNPEGTARVIEAQKPDVIALQEISRGWLISGSLDVAEWLSRRLQMPYVYAPAHDYQFGNIILSRMPITNWSFTRLPLLNVPMGRSLIQADIDLGGGKSITIINTHLSAYASTDDRVPQVQKVIETWNKSPRTLIMGDMNAHPGDTDMQLFLDAGLTSAQDATGKADLLTFSSAEPVERIDWIFGTAEFSFKDFEIPSTQASDHLPLLVTVDLNG